MVNVYKLQFTDQKFIECTSPDWLSPYTKVDYINQVMKDLCEQLIGSSPSVWLDGNIHHMCCHDDIISEKSWNLMVAILKEVFDGHATFSHSVTYGMGDDTTVATISFKMD